MSVVENRNLLRDPMMSPHPPPALFTMNDDGEFLSAGASKGSTNKSPSSVIRWIVGKIPPDRKSHTMDGDDLWLPGSFADISINFD